MELQWAASRQASCFLDVNSWLQQGTTGSGDLDAALHGQLTPLRSFLEIEGLEASNLFAQLIPLSARTSSFRELARLALRRAVGSHRAELDFSLLAGHLTDCFQAWDRNLPAVETQLTQDLGEWQDAWVTWVRRIVHRIGELTEPGLMAESASIVVVATQGGPVSRSYEAFNMVLWSAEEKVTDPESQWKLAWLLARQNQDLPIYTEELQPASRAHLAAKALIPAVLASCPEASSEPSEIETPLLTSIVSRWLGDQESAAEVSPILAHWWRTYCQTRPAWSTALLGLERLLQASREAMVLA